MTVKMHSEATYLNGVTPHCLKIKVSPIIPSYVYILSGQKSIKNVKNGRFWPEACGQTVLPDMSLLIGHKLVENAQIQMRHFE